MQSDFWSLIFIFKFLIIQVPPPIFNFHLQLLRWKLWPSVLRHPFIGSHQVKTEIVSKFDAHCSNMFTFCIISTLRCKIHPQISDLFLWRFPWFFGLQLCHSTFQQPPNRFQQTDTLRTSPFPELYVDILFCFYIDLRRSEIVRNSFFILPFNFPSELSTTKFNALQLNEYPSILDNPIVQTNLHSTKNTINIFIVSNLSFVVSFEPFEVYCPNFGLPLSIIATGTQ